MCNYSWCICVNDHYSYSFSQASLFTPTWLDNLRCSGTESRLIDCPANSIGVENCFHIEDVALICAGISTISKNIDIMSYKYCERITCAGIRGVARTLRKEMLPRPEATPLINDIIVNSWAWPNLLHTCICIQKPILLRKRTSL